MATIKYSQLKIQHNLTAKATSLNKYIFFLLKQIATAVNLIYNSSVNYNDNKSQSVH